MLQARSIAAHAGVMEFDFKFAEVAEQVRHFVGELCGLTESVYPTPHRSRPNAPVPVASDKPR